MKGLLTALVLTSAAFALSAADTAAKEEWQALSRRIETMRRDCAKSLDAAVSHESRLALIDASLADRRWAERAAWLKERRFEALADLGRDAEAEAYALSLIASADERERRALHVRLGDFYVGRAARYCSRPDAKTLAKAAEQYRKAVALCGKDFSQAQRTLHKAADCLYRAGDFAAAREALGEESALVGSLHERARAQVTEQIAVLRGDMLFDEKDYAGALREWLAYGESLKKTNAARLERVCRAFSGAGRRAEMLPYLEALAKKGNKYTRLRYEYDLDVLKKETGAK